ncbi:hypothetical protein EYZ11_001007 [Aspergillus tanneri]|uniref:Transcription factor Iwr1 domain-containing protein n=1 Tax=Aspergillus tanneri TaxID=1220188 RepID=A0A4S3JVV3_9EURO|nr:uncharacterized protein ATNIH1004_002644 [Aspergillus tanneri]KAA8649964.1 hypothetical protein ATNIH1004_002644 [Aspergillus tanneri]THC99547.1 hypothetical protein EYZ11_001007 [Aspergillus tanneri]
MALPPEQINIKRRREEEPVDTLYIQSELHQTKRRFTDFVFQRVQIKGDGGSSGSPSPAKGALRSPRSVSSVNFPTTAHSRPAWTGSVGGVPLVRATTPGAEIREAKRLATIRKEKEEKLYRALRSSPTAPETRHAHDNGAGDDELASVPTTSSGRASPAPSASPVVRRFQISRSKSLLRGTSGGGVQKRKGDGAVAVLVEKLRRKPHSRQASMVADAVVQAEGDTGRYEIASTKITDLRDNLAQHEEEAPTPQRKRPVVNKAEREWREERKTAISAAKQHITQVLEKEAQAQHQTNWDDESDRLAQEFQQIALEIEREVEEDTDEDTEILATRSTQARSHPRMPKAPLKYPPRTPNKLRARPAESPQGCEVLVKAAVIATPTTNTTAPAAAAATATTPQAAPDVEHEDDSDGEYVYDTYIRKPLPEIEEGGGGLLTNPLVDLQLDQEAWLRQNGIDTTRADIGVIVITQEDEEYWESFVEEEDDEERWDSEDGDSNAENNPANEYPDEELSWDDEDDDRLAIYHKYRRHAVSDDEEFDSDESANERWFGPSGRRSHVESDDESW